MKKQSVSTSLPDQCPPHSGGQAGMGHNGGPDMEAQRLFELIGPRQDEPIAPFDTGQAWVKQATTEELAKLEKLHRWLEIKKRSLDDLQTEYTCIMRRCIKRNSRKKRKPNDDS